MVPGFLQRRFRDTEELCELERPEPAESFGDVSRR
jgi:hypothetical protein